MRMIRDHGMRPGKRYWHDEIGFNFRLTNLQAALGCGQLEAVESILGERRRVYEAYRRRLDGQGGLALQRFTEGVEPVVWAVALTLDPTRFPAGRDGVIQALLDGGVETRPGFYPFTVMPLYQSFRQRALPAAEELGSRVISVPTFPALTEEEIEEVCTRLLALRS
jgi:perosamine synthetase